MDKRAKKQFFIAAIFFIFVFLIIGGIYSAFRTPETCFDNIQNQKEEGADCGGPCASCEEKIIKPLEIVKTYFFPVRDNFYDGLVRVRNLNLRHGAGVFSYTFRLFDGQGKEIGQKTGKSFILPGQSKYIIEPLIEAAGNPARINFSLSEIKFEQLKDFGDFKLNVKNKSYSKTSTEAGEIGFSKAEGVVFNDTSYDLDMVGVNVVLIGANNSPVAVNRTEMRTLTAGEERYFKVIWFSPFAGEVKNIEVEPETNVFLQETFLKRFSQ